MADYSFLLSGREKTTGQKVKDIITHAIDHSLFSGDMWSSWSDLKDAGDIKINLRSISVLLYLENLNRVEFLYFTDNLISDEFNCDDKDINELFKMLMESEKEPEAETEAQLDIFGG